MVSSCTRYINIRFIPTSSVNPRHWFHIQKLFKANTCNCARAHNLQRNIESILVHLLPLCICYQIRLCFHKSSIVLLHLIECLYIQSQQKNTHKVFGPRNNNQNSTSPTKNQRSCYAGTWRGRENFAPGQLIARKQIRYYHPLLDLSSCNQLFMSRYFFENQETLQKYMENIRICLSSYVVSLVVLSHFDIIRPNKKASKGNLANVFYHIKTAGPGLSTQ